MILLNYRKLKIDWAVVLMILSVSGCAATRESRVASETTAEKPIAARLTVEEPAPHAQPDDSHNEVIVFVSDVKEFNKDGQAVARISDGPSGNSMLDDFIALGLESNPGLRRLEQESFAAWAKVNQVDALPDPVIGANVFGHPIETAAGSQRANFSLSQRLPWLKRLDAQGQQAAYTAMVLEQLHRTAQLKLVADIKAFYYRLYVLGQQIRINKENQIEIDSLIRVANKRVRPAKASPGDVFLATLESSNLRVESETLRQKLASTTAKLNGLLNRPSETPIPIPGSLTPTNHLPTLDELREIAFEYQPEIAAARLRTQATNWGVRVAELRRLPEPSLNFNWSFIDDNRPPSGIVNVGKDAWSLGGMVNIPLWTDKYDAIEAEATRRHFAAHAFTEDVVRRYDVLLADLLEQARAAAAQTDLYRDEILQQADRILNIDRESYSQGTIEFDRVIDDFRMLLKLQENYHRFLGELATIQARIEQATGAGLNSIPFEEAP